MYPICKCAISVSRRHTRLTIPTAGLGTSLSRRPMCADCDDAITSESLLMITIDVNYTYYADIE